MNPFTDSLPSEIPLPRAPLVRVLCQIRFPAVLSVESQEFVAPFQEELRQQYPILRQEQSTGLAIGPSGVVPAKSETAWRFHDLANDWRVSLSPTFVALETTKYPGRQAFLERLLAVVVAAERHVKLAVVDRIGLRYLDRLSEEAMQKLPELVRPEILGIAATEVNAQVSHSVTETVFEVGSAQMMARWGQIPAMATMDPDLMQPIDRPSWILDLDIFTKEGEATSFIANDVLTKVRGFAERIHSVFRWCVTEEFLRYYGGEI